MTGPRILHLFANYKWTGPADPAIRGAVHLRRLGLDARFAQAEWTLPGAEHRMAIELWRARLPVVGGLGLRKHFRLRSVRRDARRLGQLLRGDRYDVVHCHLLADHLVAALACRRLRRAGGPVPILVRTLYDPLAPRGGWRNRLAFAQTDGVVVPTPELGDEVAARFGIPADRILFQDPPTEVPTVAADGLRGQLDLKPDDLVVGITARIQPHRRFDLLWEVARRVADVEPRARFVLLGRGNERDTRELVRDPIANLGLADHVRLPGYLYEPDYGRALRSLDVFLFLVPGSDGTCRAVREAMALGLPVVATDRGILPALLRADPLDPKSGVTGFIGPEDAGALAGGVLQLLRDESLAKSMGNSARGRARSYMDPTRAARTLAAFYRRLQQEDPEHAS